MGPLDMEDGSASTIVLLTPVQNSGRFCFHVAEPLFSFPPSVDLVLGDASRCLHLSGCLCYCPYPAFYSWADQAPPPPGNKLGYFRRGPAVRLVYGSGLFHKQEVRPRRNSAIYIKDLVAPPHRCCSYPPIRPSFCPSVDLSGR